MADVGGGLLISKHNEIEIQSTVWVQKGKPEATNILNNIKMIKTLIKKWNILWHTISFKLSDISLSCYCCNSVASRWGRLEFKFSAKELSV